MKNQRQKKQNYYIPMLKDVEERIGYADNWKDFQMVEVTEEVYKEYYRPIWRQWKKLKKHGECTGIDWKRCQGDCEHCKHFRPQDSLDADLKQRPVYVLQLTKSNTDVKKSDGIHSWYKVKKVSSTNETKIVYNLTVEEDNSYVADGIVVHNCQDLSIAGKRAGLNLEGGRSNLFYQAVRIIKEMRSATNGKYPKYIVWENVPGAFSSNNGQDFKAVLESIIGIVEEKAEVPDPGKDGWSYADCYMGDQWSVAYRVMDAQYWGVPQRRRRIFLVADLGGRSAGDILFKSEGLSRYSSESFRAWQRAANGTEECVGASGIGFDGYNGSVDEKAATLGVNCGMSSGRNGIVLNDQGGNRMDVTEDVACTLRAEAHHPPVVMEEIALENHPADCRIKIEEEGKVQTLSSRMGTGGNNVPLVLKIRSGCEGGGKGNE